MELMADYTAKERVRRWRLKQKLEKESQIDKNDLNYGMKPIKDIFPSMEEYLEANPDKTKGDYIRLKIAWDKETAQNQKEEVERESREIRGVLGLEPLNSKTKSQCIRFRRAYLNLSFENEPFRIQNHNATCEQCGKWLASYSKSIGIKGINLWNREN